MGEINNRLQLVIRISSIHSIIMVNIGEFYGPWGIWKTTVSNIARK